MAHHIYQSEGFVVAHNPRSEADRSILIFTRELGMIRAVATGVRLGKSKLAGHLQEYSYGKFAFVKGRDVWRITDASAAIHATSAIKAKRLHYEVYVRTLSVLKRLLSGEEPHPDLFDIVKNGVEYLPHAADLLGTECLIMIRILHALGYVGDEASVQRFAGTEEFSDEMVTELLKDRANVIKAINGGLKESHL